MKRIRTTKAYMIKKGMWALCVLILFKTPVSAQNPKSFEVISNKGARGLMPENTLPSFLKAIELGATMIEMDVVVNKLLQPVNSSEPWFESKLCIDSSDNSISRNKEKNFNIYKMSYDEIKLFDCGNKRNSDFPDQRNLPVIKPLLREALLNCEQFRGERRLKPVQYLINIRSSVETEKTFHPDPLTFSKAVVKAVKEGGVFDNTTFISTDFRILKELKALYPECKIGIFVEGKINLEDLQIKLGFAPNIILADLKQFSVENIALFNQKAILLYAYIVNDVEDINKLRELGANGVVTDYPNRVILNKE